MRTAPAAPIPGADLPNGLGVAHDAQPVALSQDRVTARNQDGQAAVNQRDQAPLNERSIRTDEAAVR